MFPIGQGIMRTIRTGDDDDVIDIIPADIVVNTMIAAAWQIGTEKNSKLPVYNCTSGNQNPITMKEFWESIAINLRKNPFENIMWYVFLIRCNSDFLFKWLTYFVQYLPAVIIDFFMKCIGEKPK